MEEKNKFDAPFAKKFMITVGEDYLIDSFKPTYYFKFQEAKMKDFLKTYKYYNIEKEKIEDFNVYNPLKHLTYGLIFDLGKNQTLKTKWLAPANRIDFTLDLSNKKINVNVQQTKNNAYVKEIYLWANKFVVIDSFNLELVTSSTGIQGINGNTLRQAFAAYYLERKDDLIFSHEDNFKNLSRLKKG